MLIGPKPVQLAINRIKDLAAKVDCTPCNFNVDLTRLGKYWGITITGDFGGECSHDRNNFICKYLCPDSEYQLSYFPREEGQDDEKIPISYIES
ncbi:hypothetical protein HN903_00050 [archaeon]|jgi:hypothetical protein|nr:hypothetical protein [archaeon]MBT7128128.1 hypothetical protein [archaeon]